VECKLGRSVVGILDMLRFEGRRKGNEIIDMLYYDRCVLKYRDVWWAGCDGCG
jgi:hypothetical protein